MAKIRVVESSNRYYIDNGQGYFGAYQIDYGRYNNWENWTAKYIADGGVLETEPRTAEEPQGSTYPWTPTNQDRVAKYIMEGYYAKYGSYEMVARCWNQGEGGATNSEAAEYWRKVSGTNPTTGGFTAPTTVINIILLFKLTFVVLMFLYMGSRVQKILLKQFDGSGFKFVPTE